MFVRVRLDGVWYDIAIADISAIGVPEQANAPVHLIIGGLHAHMNAESYATVHAAWVARRRSDAGR
jgi:hypothetical protein